MNGGVHCRYRRSQNARYDVVGSIELYGVRSMTGELVETWQLRIMLYAVSTPYFWLLLTN